MNSNCNYPAPQRDFFCPFLLVFKKVSTNPKGFLSVFRKFSASVVTVTMVVLGSPFHALADGENVSSGDPSIITDTICVDASASVPDMMEAMNPEIPPAMLAGAMAGPQEPVAAAPEPGAEQEIETDKNGFVPVVFAAREDYMLTHLDPEGLWLALNLPGGRVVRVIGFEVETLPDTDEIGAPDQYRISNIILNDGTRREFSGNDTFEFSCPVARDPQGRPQPNWATYNVRVVVDNWALPFCRPIIRLGKTDGSGWTEMATITSNWGRGWTLKTVR